MSRVYSIVFFCLSWVIASAQNVGISDQSSFTPLAPLHIEFELDGSDSMEVVRIVRTTSSATDKSGYMGMYLQEGATAKELGRISWKSQGALSDGNGSLLFATSSNSTLNTQMVIDSAGNIGVGTNEPIYRFHVSSGAMGVDDISVDGIAYLGDSTYIGNGVNQYMMPQMKGDSGQVLEFDGNEVQWKDPSAYTLIDNDSNTYIAINQAEDTIQFVFRDTARMQMSGGVLEPLNTGESSYFGLGAGRADTRAKSGVANLYNAGFGNYSLNSVTDGSENSALGYKSLYRLTTGLKNTAIGGEALKNNETGSANLALGYYAGYNSTGSRNVFIGNNAGGLLTTGDDLLYIDNSNTSNPLIYGNFASNMLRVNGSLQVGDPSNNGFVLPTTDGSTGQVMITDGYGYPYWTDFSMSSLQDADNDTKIFVEKNLDEDQMRFFLAGKEKLALQENATGNWRWSSNSSNVAIGGNTGGNFDTTSSKSVAIGQNALQGAANSGNVAVGYHSQQNVSHTGVGNTSLGYNALYGNLNGNYNLALGYESALTNLSGSYNIALGQWSLKQNAAGDNNIAIGFNAGKGSQSHSKENGIYIGNQAGLNDTSDNNIAIGKYALYSNANGREGLALGNQTLQSNTSGQKNTGLGHYALFSTTSGHYNLGIGYKAGSGNVSGQQNVYVGYGAGELVTASNYNVAIGANSGRADNGGFNVFVGHRSGYGATGSYNVMLGYQAGSYETGSNRLYIENSSLGETQALIYGEFDNDILRVNGTLQVSDPNGVGYALPSSDGNEGEILTSNGSGQVSWQDARTLSIDKSYTEISTCSWCDIDTSKSVQLLNSSGSTIQSYLPDASEAAGKMFYFKSVGFSNPMWIYAKGSDTIETGDRIQFLSNYEYVQLFSDGTKWLILNKSSNVSLQN